MRKKILKPINTLMIAFLTAMCGIISVSIYADTSAGDPPSLSSENTESTVFSQKGNFELGGIIGMPSGLNSRYWLTDRLGFDLALGSTVNRDFLLTFDFLLEPFELYRGHDHYMRFFIGAGTMTGYINGASYLNLRVPVGLSMPFTTYPVVFSFYVAPAMIFTAKSGPDLNWGIAARYNFNTAERIISREEKLVMAHQDLQQRHGSITDQLNSTRNDLDQTRNDLERTRDDMDRTINELKKTRGELDSTKGQLTVTKGDLGKTIDRLTVTRNELDETRSKLTGTKESLESATSELNEAKDKLDTARDELITVRRELDSVKYDLDSTREELLRAGRRINDREAELREKQAELSTARTFIKEALTGIQKEQEEKKIAVKQEELNREVETLRKEREALQKENEKQKTKREALKTECESRRGIINEQGYCDCRQHEQWNSDRSACVCVKGYRLNSATDRCEPCETVNFNGYCVAGCASDERRVALNKGAHKYLCVKRCVKSNEVWSPGKGSCQCRDGYYRDSKGDCVPRR